MLRIACSIILSRTVSNLPTAAFRIFPSLQAIVIHTQNPDDTYKSSGFLVCGIVFSKLQFGEGCRKTRKITADKKCRYPLSDKFCLSETFKIKIVSQREIIRIRQENKKAEFLMSKELIAYFSVAGNNYWNGQIVNLEKGTTEKVAEKLQKLTGANIYEIRTQKNMSQIMKKEPKKQKQSSEAMLDRCFRKNFLT